MLCYFCMHEKNDAAICPFCHNSGSPVPAPHQLVPGTVLKDRYVIGRVIGEGGFGITYLGRDNVFEIPVAIKEYFPYGYSQRNNTASKTVSIVGESAVFSKGKIRFLQEAKNLAKFRGQPGIVEVTDFIEENNTAYIVMEYLDGINLRTYLKQNGVMTAERAFAMLIPIMESLEKIHRTGIIHRDISPENIMVMNNGTLKLMDFGAARDYENEEKSLSVILKHGYAPEEQYRRRGEQGPWTDVYAICATIYRCITGKTPPDSVDRLYSDSLIKPSALGAAITPRLEAVLLYGLAVRKENRCPDMTTLVKMVKEAMAQKQVSPPAPAKPPVYYQPPVRQVEGQRSYRPPVQQEQDAYATVAVNGENTALTGGQFVQPQTKSQQKTDYPAVAPVSENKKDSSKGVRIVVITLICCIAVGIITGVVMIFGSSTGSSTVASSSNAQKTRLNDEASLLMSDEKEWLSSKLDKISEENSFDIVILTVNSLNGKTDQEYAEDYYDSHQYGYGQDHDGVLLLYAVKDKRIYICTSGRGITLLTNSDINGMLDMLSERFSYKEYYAGMSGFISRVEKKL